MGHPKNEQEVIDYGATLREWPKKIWEWEEVPEYYGPCIEPLREQGMPLSAMVWVPSKGYERGSYEYLAVRFGGKIFLFSPQKDGSIEQTVFDINSIVYIQDLEYMLNCEYRFYYQENGQIKRAALPYNQAVQYLFLPFLHTALGLEEDFSFTQRMKIHPRPEHLLHDDHALYSYSEAAYRLGEEIQDYDWGTYEVVTRKLFFHTKKECAWMLCRTKGGDCLIEYGANYHETIYLPAPFGEVFWQGENILRLTVKTGEKTYHIKDLVCKTRESKRKN